MACDQYYAFGNADKVNPKTEGSFVGPLLVVMHQLQSARFRSASNPSCNFSLTTGEKVAQTLNIILLHDLPA